jgi:hypothetical protein
MAQARPLPSGFLSDALTALRRDGWATVLRVAARPAKPSISQRMFLGMMSGFASSLWTPRHPALVSAGIFWQYARHATGLGSIRLRPLNFTVPHSALSNARFPDPTSEAGRLLDRYLLHTLFRKDLAFAPDIRRGLNLTLVNMALVRWYAAALAHAESPQNPSQPTLQHWSDALRHMETLYGLNSRLYQRLTDLPILDAVLESFFRRRDFPFIITGER